MRVDIHVAKPEDPPRPQGVIHVIKRSSGTHGQQQPRVLGRTSQIGVNGVVPRGNGPLGGLVAVDAELGAGAGCDGEGGAGGAVGAAAVGGRGRGGVLDWQEGQSRVWAGGAWSAVRARRAS